MLCPNIGLVFTHEGVLILTGAPAVASLGPGPGHVSSRSHHTSLCTTYSERERGFTFLHLDGAVWCVYLNVHVCGCIYTLAGLSVVFEAWE